MMTLLPEVPDFSTYETLFKQNELWLPVMQHLCRQHGLPASELQRCSTGSAIVYRCAGHILKLFAPIWPGECAREVLGLSACHSLPVSVPELTGSGQCENWDYLIMQELPGHSLGDLWPTLPTAAQQPLLVQMADIMRALHSLPLPQQGDLGPDWPGFVSTQCAGFARQQLARGLSAAWTEALHDWLHAHLSRLPESASVLLHSDLTDDHFLVQEIQGQWRITGLIDFGDLMQGHPWYEFGAPLVFYTRGRPDLRRQLLKAYGLTLSPELGEALFVVLLLHRFVNIPYYLRHWCPPDIQTAEQMQQFFCGLEA